MTAPRLARLAQEPPTKLNSQAATILLCKNNQKGALEKGKKEAQGLSDLAVRGQCHQAAFMQCLLYAWHYSECGNFYLQLVLHEPFEVGFITSPTLKASKLRPRESQSISCQAALKWQSGRAPEPASG